MFAMVALGAGEVLGCIFIGQVIDRYGSKIASVINVILIASTTLISLFFLSVNRFNYLAYMMTFLWGL